MHNVSWLANYVLRCSSYRDRWTMANTIFKNKKDVHIIGYPDDNMQCMCLCHVSDPGCGRSDCKCSERWGPCWRRFVRTGLQGIDGCGLAPWWSKLIVPLARKSVSVRTWHHFNMWHTISDRIVQPSRSHADRAQLNKLSGRKVRHNSTAHFPCQRKGNKPSRSLSRSSSQWWSCVTFCCFSPACQSVWCHIDRHTNRSGAHGSLHK